MKGLIEGLRSGSWLTRERMRGYALILIGAHLLAIIALVVTTRGNVDYAGRPLGTDFSDVWTAGRLALLGRPTEIYNPVLHHAMQQATFHRADIPFYGWHYPPFFLLIAVALAWMPYALALAVWQGATLPLYLAGMRAIRREPMALLLALAYPAVFINLTHGHNGFLSAALIGGALVLLPGRPWLAGVLFGLLAYKPQFGLFIPIALAASGRWRSFASAALTVVLLTAVTTAAFGVDIWRAFAANTAFTRNVVLEQGGAGFYKVMSAFAAVRMWGGSIPLAYGAQGVVTAFGAVGVALLWRSSADLRLKGAGLMAACLIGTPYCLDYDFMILAPALALYASYAWDTGFRPYERSLLFVIYATPLFARAVAHYTLLPAGFAAALGMFVLVLVRARSDLAGTAAAGATAPAIA
ncbi:glycosyltransferase family 87 protein [Caulobacter sp. KR2-114]|uniref:glycosyltransferase family 87 protein n=1 Tax=Caulobacter sp. KR2-114 TaxID=3400912 RepID=UPI003C109290